MPHQDRATQTVEAIVTAAEHVLVERGYAGASTNAIARLAGVSIGSLYQYFRDKEDVFRAVVKRHRQEVMPVIEAMLLRMYQPNSDLVELTLELLRRMAAVNARNPRLLTAIDRELLWLERADDEEAAACEAVASVLRSRADVRGRFPIDVTATLMVAIVAPLSRWMVHGKPGSVDADCLITAFGQMLRGLLQPARDE